MTEDEEPTPVDPTTPQEDHDRDEHPHDDGGDLLEDERLDLVVIELRELYMVPPSAEVAQEHLARMLAAVPIAAGGTVVPIARGRRRRRRGAIAGAVVAATLAGSVGLAAAGALPGPLQDGVAAALRPLGVQLSTSGSDSPQSPASVDPPPTTASTTSVSSPGRSDDAPGLGGENPGKSEDAPGQAKDPGRSEDAPGHGGENPGKADEAPSRTGETPGKSDEAPGQGGVNPGNPGGVATTPAPPSTVPPARPSSTVKPGPPSSVTPPTSRTPPTTRVPPTTRRPVAEPEKSKAP